MSNNTLQLVGAAAVAAVAGYVIGSASAQNSSDSGKKKQWRKIVMLFGPPGADKGTQAPKIVDKLRLPHLSTGDMLRAAVAAQTEVGKKAKELMQSGQLVTDDIVIGIIRDRINESDCGWGFILDGFPRTLPQAKALDEMLANGYGETVTTVVNFSIPDEVLEERICGRWIHKKSGRSYHVKNAKPKSLVAAGKGATPSAANMKDDVTGEDLMQRSDDNSAALKKRLSEYHSKTTPILNHYNSTGVDGVVKSINANQAAEKVWGDVDSIEF